MNSILTAILAITVVAADSEITGNRLLESLLEKGVPLSDGSAVKLPPPTMPNGLDAAGQQAVIEHLASPNHPVEELMRNANVAPFELAIRSITASGGKALAREVDVHFVAYGNWEAMKSKDFLQSLMNFSGARQAGPQSPRSGFLGQEALAKRGIEVLRQPGQEEGLFFAAVSMFDRVQLSATRHILITRQPDSLTLAARIDPRFNADPEYPNQWRSMKRDLSDPEKVTLGSPQVYISAGFYGKVTRLAQPTGAMLIEYHVVFEEPEGWFQGANLLASKLPLVIQDVVRSSRRKLVSLSDGKPRD